MKTKLEFILAGGAVQRYHTLRTLTTQTVAEHSFGVAWLCWLLTEGNPRAALLLNALSHDVAEHTTGDLPAPAKRRMGVGAAFAAAEGVAMSHAGIETAFMSSYEWRTLKLADTMELLLFCIGEIALGNRGMCVVYGRGLSYIAEMEPLVGAEQELLTTIGELYDEKCK